MNTHPIDSNPASYVPTVLALYLSLPDMPRRRSRGCGKVGTGQTARVRSLRTCPETSEGTMEGICGELWGR